MRQIKFRAWNKDANSFYESIGTSTNFFFGINSKERLVFEKYLGKGQWQEEPLQQYTGLKDKNGKEIYEGDLVKIFDWGLEAHKVEWAEELGMWSIAVFLIDQKMMESVNDKTDWEGKIFEVVGNIYENSELVKGREL